MRRALSWLAICLVASGCVPEAGGSVPASAGRSVNLATQLPAGELVTGRLAADSVEGACPYLEAADGTRYQVIWPEGWTLASGNLELTDPDGTVVARAGDEVAVRGSRAPEVATTCQVGPVFRATEVVSP